MENKDFAVFILTHGRPDNVKTLSTLKKCGYTGRIYFIVDNEDKTIDKYIQNYGVENVKVFDKRAMVGNIDRGNSFNEFNIVVFARNACHNIAKELGITYYAQFDDDYYYFGYRYLTGAKIIKNIDAVFDSILKYYKSTNIKSICFSQGGDHIGGFSGIKLKRKAMNSFFCSTERPFEFMGATNEDVNMYCVLGSMGNVFFTFTNIQLDQKDTQTNRGGLTDIYVLSGTYIKSFYTVMMHPSGVKVSMMNANNVRLHHSIKWINTVPCIIDPKFKKN